MNIRISLGWMLSRLAWYSRIFVNRQLTELDIYSGILPFLLVISRHEGLNQDELSKKLYTDKTTTTRIIKPLVKTKYIIKKRDPNDKRNNRLYLTTKGRNILPLLKQTSKKLTKMLVTDFSDKEKELLYQFLQRMKKNAENALK